MPRGPVRMALECQMTLCHRTLILPSSLKRISVAVTWAAMLRGYAHTVVAGNKGLSFRVVTCPPSLGSRHLVYVWPTGVITPPL